jgi:reactive intermediate/imine deaminase
MDLISTPTAPTPGGHYSQATRAGGFVYVSGMLPGPAAAGEAQTFERQARATLDHCRNVLVAAGCGLDDVVQCTIYLVGVDHWKEFNEIYATVFGAHRPARAVVPVPALHFGYLIEIQMVAHCDHAS